MVLQTPTLVTPRLRLRPFGAADTDELFALMSDTRVLQYWDAPPWHDRARADRFIEACERMAADGSGARVAITRVADGAGAGEASDESGASGGAFLGWCSVTDFDPDFRSATVTYVLREDAWGHGYATDAAGALLGWAFEALDLNRVQTEADTRNPASARVLEKLGFLREGTLRENCIVDGVVSDSWVYGLLRRGWPAAEGRARAQ